MNNRKRLKTFLMYPCFRKSLFKIKNHKSKIALLIGTCVYNNLGDHLISISEKEFLQNNLPDIEIYEIPTPLYFKYRNFFRKYIYNTDIIFITGGGWMGNIWPQDDRNIQLIVEDFKDNTVMIFPQTIYYDFNCECNNVLKKAQESFAKCKKLIICTRELSSYEIACKFFSGANTILLPDIALSLNRKERKSNRRKKNIGICIRTDRESCIDDKFILNEYKNFIRLNKIKFFDTISKYNIIPVFLRGYFVNNKLREIKKYDAIVTDRLHGMIFAKLAKTTCYALDNKTGKVRGVYDCWLKQDPNIVFIDDLEQLKNFKLQMYTDNIDDSIIEHAFEKLEKLIRCL